MKQPINEIKRMQQLAGVLNENMEEGEDRMGIFDDILRLDEYS